MLDTNVFEFPGGRSPVFQYEPVSAVPADVLPPVPALPETLLAMELQRQEFSPNLQVITEAVLRDPGATLQILRLAGREYPNIEGRPVRMEDCISALGMEECLRAVEEGTIAVVPHWRSIPGLWKHSERIARSARAVAESTPGSINPDHAYLGGLLHTMGILPAFLHWHGARRQTDPALVALLLADKWSLPSFVKDLFYEVCLPGYDSGWASVMEAAHRLAIPSSTRCPLAEMLRPKFPLGA